MTQEETASERLKEIERLRSVVRHLEDVQCDLISALEAIVIAFDCGFVTIKPEAASVGLIACARKELKKAKGE